MQWKGIYMKTRNGKQHLCFYCLRTSLFNHFFNKCIVHFNCLWCITKTYFSSDLAGQKKEVSMIDLRTFLYQSYFFPSHILAEWNKRSEREVEISSLKKNLWNTCYWIYVVFDHPVTLVQLMILQKRFVL